MRLKFFQILLSCFVSSIFPLVIIAQDDEVIRISSDNVFVPVSVLDKTGKYISTLKREDFKVYENGVEQEIDSFATVDNNVTIVMLIERTGMIGLQLPRVVAAANAFVRSMRPEDSLIAMLFGADTDTVIDNLKIKDVPKGIRVGRQDIDRNGTQLYGSVDKALKTIAKVPGRKAIILFSEGYQTDRYTTKSAKSNIRDAEEGEATIYTIRFGPLYRQLNMLNMSGNQRRIKEAADYMNGLATKTGGRAFEIGQIENLDATFADVAAELVRQYTLGYAPTKIGSDGERRKITVKVNVPDAIVRARREVVYQKKEK